jgi:hypothetical protein
MVEMPLRASGELREVAVNDLEVTCVALDLAAG